MPADPAARSAAERTFAAVVALGLGLVASVLTVAGHPPWEGPTVVSLTATHGLHQGDVVAVVPLAAGAWLAWWCWRQR